MFLHTIRQMENLQEHFDVYKEEKERVFKVLKLENEQLYNLNLLLGKKQKMLNSFFLNILILYSYLLLLI